LSDSIEEPDPAIFLTFLLHKSIFCTKILQTKPPALNIEHLSLPRTKNSPFLLPFFGGHFDLVRAGWPVNIILDCKYQEGWKTVSVPRMTSGCRRS
jgi:hypothetical protein